MDGSWVYHVGVWTGQSKNTAEILAKNVSLYSIAVIMYMIVGYNLMYPGGGTGVMPELAFFLVKIIQQRLQ